MNRSVHSIRNLRYQMQTEIKALQKELDMTVVFVTHDQEEAMNMSDRIAIMNGGRIEQVGAPRDVYENPSNTFTAGFLGEANFLSHDNVEAAFLEPFNVQQGQCLFIRPERLLLKPKGPETSATRLTGEIVTASFLGSVVRYQVRLPSSTILYSDVTNLSGQRPFVVGDEVEITWASSDDIKVISHA